MKIMNVKGTVDSLPSKEIIRRKVVNTLTDTFEKYGYLPLDTSILCYYDLLASKYSGGSEILKEVYTLKDQGDRTLGLRYDLTVPFSKVISMNAGKTINLPVKRYEIGKVFRDGPVKTGRAREFYQCDVDVCGIEGSFIEAEMLMMTIECYKKLGIEVYVEINNRKLLEGFIISSGIDKELTSKVILSVDKLAKIGNKNAIDFPRAYIDDSYDFSFSGLKSAVLNYLNGQKMKNQEIVVEDVAASFQEAVVEVLATKAIKAALEKNYKIVALSGGVAANSALREKITEMAKEHNIEIKYPSLSLCTDNAAMIGCAGYYNYINGKRDDMSLNAVPNLKIDII